MTDELMGLYAASAASTDRVIAAITPDQFDAPTPCGDWDVRALLNHLVGGNKFFLSRATGTPGPTDRGADFLGGDPLAAFRTTVDELTEAFNEEGFAAKPVMTPFGDGVGAVLVSMRTNEFLMHGWDLAVATGQPRDFDPAVVAYADKAMRARQIPRGEGGMFADEQPAPAGASTLDALAAFMGRRVPAE